MESNNKRRLTSLAVFRQLYDENKDIYTILEAFIKDIICKNRLVNFSASQVKSLLKEEYGFNSIPEGVISATLKRSYKKENGIFFLSENQIKNLSNQDEKISLNATEISETHDAIINSLFQFVESKKAIRLDDVEKEILIQSLCEFIIDGSVSKYEEYISAFIISNQNDDEFAKKLNRIKEGVVLYSGIQYNDKINELGRWKSSLTLYLEQDVIYHLAGYNGELYKQLFDDFYDLVQEINSTSKHPIVNLRYFSETHDNIDYFFRIAERIVDGIETLDHSNNAMCHIVKGCKFKSDVIDKKASLLNILKDKNISLDDKVNYFKDNTDHAYCVETEELLTRFVKELPESTEKKIHQSLNFLSYINIRRKGNNNVGFDSIRYILLSSNSTTLRIAFDEKIKKNGDVPYATYLEYITNKFWFKLNKGFGDTNYPKTFDVITKAQISLSTQISRSVSKEFANLVAKRQAGQLNDEQVKEALILIRQQSKYPEDITPENIDSVLDCITIDNIEQLLSEREKEKQHTKEKEAENIKLRKSLEIEKEEKEKQQKQSDHLINEKHAINLALIDDLLKQKRSELVKTKKIISDLEAKRDKAERKASAKVKQMRCFPLLILVVCFFIISTLILRFGWDTMEPITYLAAFVILFIEYVWFAIKGKDIDPRKWINIDYKESVTKEQYLYYNFKQKELDDLLTEEKDLLEEIKKLSDDYKDNRI